MSIPGSQRRVGIIGAGMAGLSCADALVAQGHQVRLYDKGRGAGGRMSTRRLATSLGEASFDYGAQYFTARDADFQRLVGDWLSRGVAEYWPAAGPDALVGVPTMNAIVRDMAARHDARFGVHVQGVTRLNAGWRLLGEDLDPEEFDTVIVAVPAEQAAALLGSVDLAMARHATIARSQPCWTAMFAFARPLDTKVTVVRSEGVIGWAARNSAKAGRQGPEAWVVQARSNWSAEHFDTRSDAVEDLLLAALGEALAVNLGEPISASTHRWRYALSAGLSDGALWNDRLNIGVCGDWLLGPRIECAWRSGKALAERMLRMKNVP